VSGFGWRARIGLILPADNVVAEPELYSLGLPGISFHASRLTVTEHAQMRRQALDSATAFAEMGVDVVVYACAETSFNAGEDARGRLPQIIQEACGLPVVTATTAILEAVTALDLKRVAVVTPYTDRSGRLFESALAGQGVEVLAARHRDFRVGSRDPREWYETNRQPPTTAYHMLRDADSDGVDGVVASATNLAMLQLLEEAEQDLGKPVVGCNQSILWWCLRELGIKQPIPGYGALLRAER
jgi:maleate cis-trans isomerase